MDDNAFKAALDRDPAFTPKMALEFAMLSQKQAESVYEKEGITFPVSASSTVLYLTKVKSASLLQIARALNHSHQLIAQRLKTLSKLELIDSMPDPDDGRRTAYQLTRQGREVSARLQTYLDVAGDVFEALSEEIGLDLLSVLRAAVTALEETPLAHRYDVLRNGTDCNDI